MKNVDKSPYDFHIGPFLTFFAQNITVYALLVRHGASFFF